MSTDKKEETIDEKLTRRYPPKKGFSFYLGKLISDRHRKRIDRNEAYRCDFLKKEGRR